MMGIDIQRAPPRPHDSSAPLEGAHFDTCLIEQIEGYFVAIVADHQSWSQREHVPAEIPHLPKALDLISVAYGNKPYRGLTKRIGEHLAPVGADGLRPDAIGSGGQLAHVHIAAQEGVEQERVPIDHGQHSIEQKSCVGLSRYSSAPRWMYFMSKGSRWR